MKLRAADLFCGAGGTSAGARATGEADVVFALNHWDRAIETHSANFPGTKHVNSRLEDTHPSECGKIDLLFASPECTHHARARGGKPTSDQQRAGAWYVLPWIEHHRPSWIVIENVSEFKEWGPVGVDGKPLPSKKGKFFDAWLMAIQAAGYKLDYQEINAANMGAATSRNRLFIVARKGNRNPVFPEPTHSKTVGGELPGFALPKWRTAAEVIDWSIPCPSVFSRKRPLADQTLLRIEAGLRRFVEPYIVQFNEGTDRRVHSPDSPLPTIMAGGKRFGIAVPFQVIMRNHMDSADIAGPLNTITAGGGHHGVAVPFLTDVNHTGADRIYPLSGTLGTTTTKNGKAVVAPLLGPIQDPEFARMQRLLHQWNNWPSDEPGESNRSEFVLSTGSGGAPRSVRQPLPTIVTRDGTALVMPWIAHYYGTNNQSPVSDPLDTITTKERHGLCAARYTGPQDWPTPGTDAMTTLQATMRELGVCDVGFRMLSNPELGLAQGFDRDYIFHGKNHEITRQIGNSVSPPVAEAITRAILSA